MDRLDHGLCIIWGGFRCCVCRGFVLCFLKTKNLIRLVDLWCVDLTSVSIKLLLLRLDLARAGGSCWYNVYEKALDEQVLETLSLVFARPSVCGLFWK